MDYYFEIHLSRKVPTRRNKGGMDTAVCRAETGREAIAQLLPEMRVCVLRVIRHEEMRDCYENPHGILRDDVI